MVARYDCSSSMFGKAPKLRRTLQAMGTSPVDSIYIGDEVRDGEAGLPFGAVAWGYTHPDTLAPLATGRCSARSRSSPRRSVRLGLRLRATCPSTPTEPPPRVTARRRGAVGEDGGPSGSTGGRRA